jgi:hypothetical protein
MAVTLEASGAAVSTILKIMLDKDARASSTLRAAESVVTHAAKAIEQLPKGKADLRAANRH